jgi:hypothetical protein
MSKVILAFSGISYGPGQRDWRRDIDNITNNIIKPFNTDIYFCTYPSETSSELIDRYSPTKFKFIDFSGSDTRTTYKQTLELLLDVDFDLAITTRFDIRFDENFPVSKYNYDPNKINLLFKEQDWWNDHKYTCDPQCFSIFPKKFLRSMIETTQELYDRPHRQGCMDLHPFYAYITNNRIKESDINFIFNEETHSHDNKYFVFDRWSPWWPNHVGL